MPLDAFNNLSTLEYQVFAEEELRAFQRAALAFGGDKKAVADFLGPFKGILKPVSRTKKPKLDPDVLFPKGTI